jgi:hypothetical protein
MCTFCHTLSADIAHAGRTARFDGNIARHDNRSGIHEETSMGNNEKGAIFRSLHRAGQPLALFNVWDAGSARAVADAGAAALATGSWSVAAANGFGDGEQMPRALMMEVLERIVRATDLPVTVDLESGYGERPAEVAETITMSIGPAAAISKTVFRPRANCATSTKRRPASRQPGKPPIARAPTTSSTRAPTCSSRQPPIRTTNDCSTRRRRAPALMRRPAPTACSCRACARRR